MLAMTANPISAAKMQKVYLYLDDSGVFTHAEKCVTFCGLVFSDLASKESFKRRFISINKSIRCKYCSKDLSNCDKGCPEIKNINIKDDDKRRIMNLIKSERCYALIINTPRVYASIMRNANSKGRYLDYAKKLMIKSILHGLLNEGVINSIDPLTIIVQMDQSTTKSNGRYPLAEGIYEELKCGIINYDYGKFFPPILTNLSSVDLSYHESIQNVMIQAADFVAGTVRTCYLTMTEEEQVKELEFIDHLLMLP